MPSPSDLAVIVCSRERPEMLAEALATIVRHTPTETEIVVVDSASTTAATGEAARSAGVACFRTDVKGLSIARNVGLRATSRPYLVYTDDDCVAIEGWTAGILAAFADERVGAVTGQMVDHTAAPSSDRDVVVYDDVVAGLDSGHGALMAFRRDVLVRLGGFDELLGAGRRLAGAEDLDMLCRVIADGNVVVHDPASIVHHVHTREDDAYTRLYYGYGLGLGGLVTKWLRMRPVTGIRMGTVLAGRAARRAWRERRDPRRAPAERALLRGIVRGAMATLGVPLDSGRYRDTRPPAPILLPAEKGTP